MRRAEGVATRGSADRPFLRVVVAARDPTMWAREIERIQTCAIRKADREASLAGLCGPLHLSLAGHGDSNPVASNSTAGGAPKTAASTTSALLANGGLSPGTASDDPLS